MMGKPTPRVQPALIGATGVHFVVSELSLRGLIALPTIRNTAGFDIVVVSADGEWHANLQVKTSKDKVGFWPVGKGYEKLRGDHNYYVFVRYLKKEGRFEAFLEPANQVTRDVDVAVERDKERGNVEWSPCWYLPKDEENLERVRQQWQEFGPGRFA
jgi:hypothetical protein